MSIKTRDSLKTFWNNYINQNGVNSIIGLNMNKGGVDIIDSLEPRTYQQEWNDGNITMSPYFDGSVVSWGSSATADGTFTLDNSVPTGYRFMVLNVDNKGYVLNFDVGSGSIISSNGSIVRNNGVAWVYKTAASQWVIDVRNTIRENLGYGTKISDSSGILISSPPIDTWKEIPLPSSYSTQELYGVIDVANNALKLSPIISTSNDLLVNIFGNISVAINSSATRILEFTYGINGTVTSIADKNASMSHAESVGATDFYISQTFVANTILHENDEISLFVKSSTSDDINIERVNLTLKYKEI